MGRERQHLITGNPGGGNGCREEESDLGVEEFGGWGGENYLG